MTIDEIFRLQGIQPRTFKRVHPPQELGRQAGNAMSVNVIERILRRALIASDLIQPEQAGPDRWQTGDAQKSLISSVAIPMENKPLILLSDPTPLNHNSTTSLPDSQIPTPGMPHSTHRRLLDSAAGPAAMRWRRSAPFCGTLDALDGCALSHSR